MDGKGNRAEFVLFTAIGLIPVTWLGLLAAPYIDDGLLDIVEGLSESIQKPFNITLCENSLRVVLLLFVAYFMGIALYWSMRKNYREKCEVGSGRTNSQKEPQYSGNRRKRCRQDQILL